jgi:hypothetical protein
MESMDHQQHQHQHQHQHNINNYSSCRDKIPVSDSERLRVGERECVRDLEEIPTLPSGSLSVELEAAMVRKYCALAPGYPA